MFDKAIANCEIVDNGSGVLQSNEAINVINSTFPNNAGTAITAVGNSPVSLENVTLSGNGAGLHVNVHSPATIVNSTITGNTYKGIHVGMWSNELMHNSIVAGNLGEGDFYFSATPFDGIVDPASSQNIVGIDDDQVLNPESNTVGIALADLKLAPLGNYGGPTRTHALLPDSPAIDAGSDAVAQAHDLIVATRGLKPSPSRRIL